MEEKTIVVERVFQAEKNLVWKALTEKELMKQWYFDLSEFKPEVGFAFEFMGGSEEKKYKHQCEITEVIPQQKMTYSWKYEGYEGISFVTFELFEENNNTRLKLTHQGIDTFPDIPDLSIENFKAGWNHIIHRSLKDFLNNNPKNPKL